MGNFQSIRTRSRTPDEEEGGYPNLENEYKSKEESMLVSLSSIYKAITKAVMQKLVVSTKEADPSSLPIQNPSPHQICFRGDSSSQSPSADTVGPLTALISGKNVDHVLSVPENEIEVKFSSSRRGRRKAREQAKRSISVADQGKTIKHYSSRHKILLVGEGDFSFSACLALAFGSAANIIATSLNSKVFLKKHYGKAMSNIEELRRREGKVMHGIDATEMANHELLRHLKFDCIIFNFPYAGHFRKSMPTESQLSLHRELVSKFLMNAKNMISENGEIHITHKTNGFHADFKVESIASSHGLKLIQAVKFKCGDYPGYNTKYGFGGDGNFDCNPSKTFKFGLK